MPNITHRPKNYYKARRQRQTFDSIMEISGYVIVAAAAAVIAYATYQIILSF